MSSEEKKPYVSCIQIKGVPILPPLITPQLRKELLKYKQQAVKLEQRLRSCRELKKDLEELLESQNERPCSQLTFSDNSHIEALNISAKPKAMREPRQFSLSTDIIEVTQYDASGMKTICSNIHLTDLNDENNIKEPCDNEKKKLVESNIAESADTCNVGANKAETKSQCHNNELHKPVTPPKPRLIRSNSYTLESPSPILLAHLKKTSCFNNKSTDLHGLASARNWTSLENNHTFFDSSDFSSIDTVYHNEHLRKNSDRSEATSSPDKSAKTICDVKSPAIEVYQTDISVQQITVNTNKIAENGSLKEEKIETFFSKNPFDVFEPDCELMNVLKDIPEVYANQIKELLRTQHVEQKERLERYDNIKQAPDIMCSTPKVYKSQSCHEIVEEKVTNEGGNSIQNTHLPKSISHCNDLLAPKDSENVTKTNIESDNHTDRPRTTESWTDSEKPSSEKLTRSSTFSMSPSQSLYYSTTSDTESLKSPTHTSQSIKIIDLEGNPTEDIEIGILRDKNGYWEGVMKHENAKNLNCSRELFPEVDSVAVRALKREWAASIIGAYSKGYLTRRLLKTEKVQGLIATIKDVLVCAVELHHSDNIDEKDVELHRRLINQLSAALYAFHETFFDLSIQEKMLIIAADRQRKIEKLKRPPSGRISSRSLSNRSMNSNRSNKSLPTSRSSSRHKLVSGSPSLTKV